MRTRNIQKATAVETDVLLDIVSSHFLLQARSQYAHLLSNILSNRGSHHPGEELRVAHEVLMNGELADVLSKVRELVSTYDATSDMLELFQSSGIELLRTKLRSGLSWVNVIAISFPDGIVHCFLEKASSKVYHLHATVHIKEASPYGILTSIAANPYLLAQLCTLCKSLGATEIFVAYEIQSHDVMNIMASGNIWLTTKGFAPVSKDTLRLLPFPRKIRDIGNNTIWNKAVEGLRSLHPRAIATDLRRLAEDTAGNVLIDELYEYASRSTSLSTFTKNINRHNGLAHHLVYMSTKSWPTLNTLRQLGAAVIDLQEFPFFHKKL